MKQTSVTRTGRLVVLLLACSTAGSGCGPSKAPSRTVAHDGSSVRYRLLLRDNPESPSEAVRCYGRCQAAPTPGKYLECLSECPGFEKTDGEYCSKTEVPPVAACLTVRRIEASAEPPPGYVVLAVVGTFALIVATASLCGASSSQCGNIPPL